MVFIHQNETIFLFGKTSKKNIVHLVGSKMTVNDLSIQVNSEFILEHNQAQFGRFVLNEKHFNRLFGQFETVFLSK